MTWASGTRRGSADSTPSTSVQMWISAASSSAPKIEAEKSLPLRPSVVCTPAAVAAMKPVMTSVPAKSGAGSCCSRRARLVPLHGRAERAPLHHHDTGAHRPSAPRRGARRAPRGSAANRRVDQISP